MYIDSHAHLFYPNFNGDLDEVINRAKANGVDYILVPGTNLATSAEAVQLAGKYDFIYAAVGVHPQDTKEWDDSLIEKIEELTHNQKVVAIGEIGLDYYYDFSPKEIQISAFKKQIDLALKLKLPIIVHNREASFDLMEIFREYKGSQLKAQFHCFAGSVNEARELIEMGHFVSFTGNITFKNADNVRKVLDKISVEDLLLETDSPFLTPVPHRGKRNEPSYVPLIAEKIAELKKIRTEDVARTTSYNAYKLFGIGEKPKLSITYQIGKNLYINVSNRCDSDCIFCDRKGEAVLNGYNLKMNKSEEPSSNEFINEIGDPKKYNEIVFCGYGEPTIRWEVVKEVAKYVKQNGGRTRLDTDGHGNVINKRDITPELKELIDSVSISLNSSDPEQYAKIMRVEPEMFDEMVAFAKSAKQYSKVTLTVVGMSQIDIEKARNFVENEIGVNFRERPYFS